MTHQPDEDTDLIERYRNAADTEGAAPSASTRAAILAEGRRAAAQRVSTLSSSFDTDRPAANQPRWKLAVWGSAAAVVLAAVLVLPRFLQEQPQVAATTARPSSQLPSEPPAQSTETRSAVAGRETGAPAAALPGRQSDASSEVTQSPAPPAARMAQAAPAANYAPAPAASAGLAALARRDERGPAVSSAVSSGDVPRLKQLLEQGAGTQQPDATGRSPLLLAVIANRPDLVKLLLEHGADPNAADAAGETPLQRARSDDHTDIVSALLRAGAH